MTSGSLADMDRVEYLQAVRGAVLATIPNAYPQLRNACSKLTSQYVSIAEAIGQDRRTFDLDLLHRAYEVVVAEKDLLEQGSVAPRYNEAMNSLPAILKQVFRSL